MQRCVEDSISITRERIDIAILTSAPVKVAPLRERDVPHIELDLRAAIGETFPLHLDLINIGERAGNHKSEQVCRLGGRPNTGSDVAIGVGDAAGCI